MYQVEAACISHMGYIRENNEDNFYFQNQFLEMEHGTMQAVMVDFFSTETIKAVAVFDGMGGENAGETASYAAAQTFAEACRIQTVSKSGFKNIINRLNTDICEKAETERLGQIGTTITALFFDRDYVYITNVGDSPAFILRGGRLKAISEKHTNEEFLKLSNMKYKRPALTQYLGIPKDEMMLEPYIAGMELQTGDIFLICSDGLTDMVPNEVIQHILSDDRQTDDMVGKLLTEALLRGGCDNITIICCKAVEDVC